MDYLVVMIISLNFCKITNSIMWDQVRCSSDADQRTPEGTVPEMGRFPWLGVVQHSFYLGGKTRFAITSGVLIHHAYVIAPAEDIAKIPLGTLANNTKFIVWGEEKEKYTMDVQDYYIHPEYEEVTFASIALLQLGSEGVTGFNDFIDKGEINKEMLRVNIVENKDCEEFYYRAKLNFKKMSPVNPVCVVSAVQSQSCVWDGGAVLISRQSWGYWNLIGFGVRGPGCGAPSRFLNIHDYLMWIDDLISDYPYDEHEEVHKFGLRRLSPVALIMYKADVKLPRDTGLCDRQVRGNVIYKDSSEILLNKNFGQGFFFVSIAQVASVNCATIILDVSSRTNLAVWIEHQCYKELTGDRRGYRKRRKLTKDKNPLECFLYFKTVAYLEFRFYFSFKALLEVTVYGVMEDPRLIPNPWISTETTDSWWPTDRWIKWGNFHPYYAWLYDL